MIGRIVTNEPDYEVRGFSGGTLFTERTDSVRLSASKGSTNSGAYPSVPAFWIHLDSHDVNLVEARIYDTGRTDGEFTTFDLLSKKFMKAGDSHKYQGKIFDELVAFVMRFAFVYGKEELSTFFLASMNQLFQAGVKSGREELQGQIRSLLDMGD